MCSNEWWNMTSWKRSLPGSLSAPAGGSGCRGRLRGLGRRGTARDRERCEPESPELRQAERPAAAADIDDRVAGATDAGQGEPIGASARTSVIGRRHADRRSGQRGSRDRTGAARARGSPSRAAPDAAELPARHGMRAWRAGDPRAAEWAGRIRRPVAPGHRVGGGVRPESLGKLDSMRMSRSPDSGRRGRADGLAAPQLPAAGDGPPGQAGPDESLRRQGPVDLALEHPLARRTGPPRRSPRSCPSAARAFEDDPSAGDRAETLRRTPVGPAAAFGQASSVTPEAPRGPGEAIRSSRPIVATTSRISATAPIERVAGEDGRPAPGGHAAPARRGRPGSAR